MPGWTCPSCERSFGRRNQSHECRPSAEDGSYWDGRPPEQRRICEAILRFVRKVGPVVVETVGVGVMIKRTRTFAEVRAKKKAVVLGVLLTGAREHPRVSKVLRLSANRAAHFIELESVREVDADVRALLEEAYLQSPP